MNDVETRTRLVREARDLFAACGYDGASIRAITKAAGANLGAVTYHFGSKRALYEAVLDVIFGELAERVEAAAAPPGPTPDRLAAVVHALFGFFEQHPHAPRLMLHQLATGDGIPAVIVPYLRRNLAAIRHVVEDGVRTGDIRAAEPNLVAFTLISQSVWFALVGRNLPAILGEGAPEAFAHRIEHHVADAVSRYVARET